MNTSLLNYKNPPVHEVACGIKFQLDERLNSLIFGQFWEEIKEEFDNVSELPAIEDGNVLFISNLPKLRRLWFSSKDNNEHLIQLQQDRVIFNWKKIEGKTYPRFELIYEEFQKYLSKYFLLDYLNKQKIVLKVEKLFLTYVNLIKFDNENDCCSVFVDHKFSDLARFPDKLQWLSESVKSDSHNLTSIITGTKKEIILELSASSINSFNEMDLSIDSLRDVENWFFGAREIITSNFSDMTSEMIQTNLWGKL